MCKACVKNYVDIFIDQLIKSPKGERRQMSCVTMTISVVFTMHHGQQNNTVPT